MASKRPTPAQAQEKLNELGLKITHPRIVIYNALLNLKDHPTAEIIYKSIHKQNPSISLGTVYKTLETFVNIGLINKVKSAEDKVRYDIRTDIHHHLYCAKSDRVIDFYDEELKELLTRFFEKRSITGFKVEEVALQISGEVLDEHAEEFLVEGSEPIETADLLEKKPSPAKEPKAPATDKQKTKKQVQEPTVPPNQLSIL